MTEKEIERLAWILTSITEVNMNGEGRYGPSAEIAQMALDAVGEIQEFYPRIKAAMEELTDLA